MVMAKCRCPPGQHDDSDFSFTDKCSGYAEFFEEIKSRAFRPGEERGRLPSFNYKQLKCRMSVDIRTVFSHQQLHRLCAFYEENSVFLATMEGIRLFNLKDLSTITCVALPRTQRIWSFDFSRQHGLLSGVHSGRCVFLSTLNGKDLLGSKRVFNIPGIVGRASIVELPTPALLASGNAYYCGFYDLEAQTETRLGPLAYVNNYEFDWERRRLLFALENEFGPSFLVADPRKHNLQGLPFGTPGVSFGTPGVFGAAIVATSEWRLATTTDAFDLQLWDLRRPASPLYSIKSQEAIYVLEYIAESDQLVFAQQQSFWGVIDLNQPLCTFRVDMEETTVAGCAVSPSGRSMAVTLPLRHTPQLLIYNL